MALDLFNCISKQLEMKNFFTKLADYYLKQLEYRFFIHCFITVFFNFTLKEKLIFYFLTYVDMSAKLVPTRFTGKVNFKKNKNLIRI